MDEFRDVDGLTAKEWAEQLFECEYCNECGGDVEDHNYVLLMGHWFAVCKTEENDETGFKIIKCPECGSEIAVDNRTIWSIDCDCGAVIEKHMVGV